jgi:ectoine hydroxylase-related dioxygenase (phytanoyl-CoA dioxygenase family)
MCFRIALSCFNVVLFTKRQYKAIGKSVFLYLEVSRASTKDGICIIPNYAEDVESEFNKILRNCGSSNSSNKVLRTTLGKLKSYKKLYSLFTNENINVIAKKLTGGVSYAQEHIFIHHDYENKQTNNTFPHYDFTRQLKFYLCVNDINENNGCFKILPNSLSLSNEKRIISKRKNVFNPNHELYNGTIVNTKDMLNITANKGDLIIFDTNVIHCGGDCFKNGLDRKIIRLHILY